MTNQLKQCEECGKYFKDIGDGVNSDNTTMCAECKKLLGNEVSEFDRIWLGLPPKTARNRRNK